MNPQDYTQLGYDISLTRTDNLITNEVDPLEFEQNTPEFSGSKLIGLLSSQDGRVKIDLDNNIIIISDGVVERVRLGKQADDSYGLIIKDINGNIIMQITGEINFIQSSNSRTKLDFVANKLTIKEESGLTRIILGEF